MRDWQRKTRELGRWAADTVLPPPNDAALISTLTYLDEPCCASCGFPFEVELVGIAKFDMQCAACLARRPAFATARSALQYDDASRPLILAFKHGGHTDRLASFAAQMHRAGRTMLSEADLILPVPLHRTRLMRRRFNQSALLARALSHRTGVAMNADLLLRPRRTRSQGGLSAVGRRRNVTGAFRVMDKAAVIGQRIVIVDDVMTTGATLEACAKILKRSGAARVDALCLARVVKPQTAP